MLKQIRTMMTGVTLLLLLVACGGGGGTSSAPPAPPAPPTKASLTFNIPRLPPTNPSVNIVTFVIQLPAGVTPAVFTGNDATASLTFTGGAAGSFGVTNYDSVNRTISLGGVTLDNSFGTGNFLIVNCKIDAGVSVTANDFSLRDIRVVDLSGDIPGATVVMTVQFS